jgi:small subunit ribosomal protein S5
MSDEIKATQPAAKPEGTPTPRAAVAGEERTFRPRSFSRDRGFDQTGGSGAGPRPARTFPPRRNPDGTPRTGSENRFPPRGDRPAGGFAPRGDRPSFGGDRRGPGGFGGGQGGGNRGGFGGGFGGKRPRTDKKPRDDEFSAFETTVIQVRRITRVVKGGKRMRFSALVVVGDKAGKVGYGLEKGLDYQESVTKATRKAKEGLISIKITEDGSVRYPMVSDYKASTIMLKPAMKGTGLIAGGFIRPVLELAGVTNVYSKIIGTNNKITGIKAMFKALENYSK